jgi:hypothetical protein
VTKNQREQLRLARVANLSDEDMEDFQLYVSGEIEDDISNLAEVRQVNQRSAASNQAEESE